MATREWGQFPLNEYKKKTLKIFSSETTGQIILIFGRNSSWVTLLQVSKIHDDI